MHHRLFHFLPVEPSFWRGTIGGIRQPRRACAHSPNANARALQWHYCCCCCCEQSKVPVLVLLLVVLMSVAMVVLVMMTAAPSQQQKAVKCGIGRAISPWLSRELFLRFVGIQTPRWKCLQLRLHLWMSVLQEATARTVRAQWQEQR